MLRHHFINPLTAYVLHLSHETVFGCCNYSAAHKLNCKTYLLFLKRVKKMVH